jgi:hypothetical protein
MFFSKTSCELFHRNRRLGCHSLLLIGAQQQRRGKELLNGLRRCLLYPTSPSLDAAVATKGRFMTDTKQREVAESAFNRSRRREAEINDALKQEEARYEAVVKNMQRLRAMRLSRGETPPKKT